MVEFKLEILRVFLLKCKCAFVFIAKIFVNVGLCHLQLAKKFYTLCCFSWKTSGNVVYVCALLAHGLFNYSVVEEYVV